MGGESGGILVFVLLADMLHTITSTIISLSTDGRPAAIATIVTFVLIMTLFFSTLVVINLVYICCKYKKLESLLIKIALLVAQCIGALLYFYGDNITAVMDQFGDDLGCGPQCRDNNRTAAIISLGVALLFYQLFPPCLGKLSQVLKEEGETKWYSASHMMVTIVKIDALYTVVVAMAQTCARSDLIISVTFLLICYVAGAIFLIAYCLSSTKTLYDDTNTDEYFWVPWAAFVVLLICFPLYVLADNQQPLDCAFGCDSSNATLNEISCNEVGNDALRLGITLLTFIIISVLSLMLFFCRKKTKAEKVI